MTMLIKTVGLLGIGFIVFAESGVFLGLFLPGDSLLFTSGFLASQGIINFWILAAVSFVSAILGDSFGYYFGRKVGPHIFRREESRFFKKEYIERTRAFYEKYGGKTIIIARFLPIVRTVAPIMAGVGKMRYLAFIFYNIVGGFLWSIGLITLGYTLGKTIPNVDHYLLPIIALIILASVSPTLWHVYGVWKEKK